MKKRITLLLAKLIQIDFFWKMLKPFSSLGSLLFRKRKHYELGLIEFAKQDQIMDALNHTSVVLNGPFKGMKYPTLQSVGSTLYPKLLGSYELEIQQEIEVLLVNNYSEIIDVGCAEGYYAVGLALRCETSNVYAYDKSEKARELCLKMAELNNVSERVFVGSELTAEGLMNFKFTGKGLIICDCEGYEKLLFTELNMKNLNNCDLIIETHDLIDIEISTYLKALIKHTHDIISIYSTDDIQKALNLNFLELENLSLTNKREILKENRKAIMEWLICRPKIMNKLKTV